MPLPIVVLGAVAVASGIYGAKKIADAKADKTEASIVNENAQRKAKNAENKLNNKRKEVKYSIEKLGRLKVKLLSTSIKKFVDDFSKIKGINLKKTSGIKELQNLYGTDIEFKELQKKSNEAYDIARPGLSGMGAGIAMAYGAYGVAGIIGTASTGTAIGSLSGAAAMNASLAWLGGGAISAGGLGIVGGMSILGGLVAGPALAVGGSLFASRARTALNEAYTYDSKAESFCSQVKTISTSLENIRKRAEQLTVLLNKLDSYLVKYVYDMHVIIRNKGVDWDIYTVSEQQKIARCMITAQTMKKVLDTRLLADNGSLSKEINRIINDGERTLLKIQKM